MTARAARCATRLMALAATLAVSACADRSRFEATGRDFRLTLVTEVTWGDQPPRRMSIEANWQLLEGSRPAGGAAIHVRAFRLAAPQISGDLDSNAAGDDQRELNRFREALSRPFLVTYAGERPTGAEFPPDTPPGVRNLLLTVAAAFPGQEPGGDQPRVATERDLVGEHMVVVRPDASARTYGKQKLKYTNLAGRESHAPVQPAITVDIVKSEWRLRFDRDRRLAQLDGEDRLAIDGELPGMTGEMSTAIRVSGIADFDARELRREIAGAEATLVHTGMVPQDANASERQRADDQRLVRGAKLDAVIAALEATGADTTRAAASARQESIARLAAFVRLDDALAPRLSARVKASPAAVARPLIQGLARADSAPVRAALLALSADENLARETRLSALAGLGRSRTADPGTMSAIDALLDHGDAEIRKMAALGYGALVERARRRDAAAAAAGSRRLAERFAAASGAGRRRELLAAMGNAQDPTLLPAIEQGLRDEDADVRAAAVRALRLVHAPSVDAAISDRMRRDPSPSVRAAAVTAASFRDPVPYAEALSALAVNDSHAYVRSAAVSLLGRTLDRAPGAEAALRTVANRDPKQEIRAAARQALQSPRPRI
jgi:hypothetical protein